MESTDKYTSTIIENINEGVPKQQNNDEERLEQKTIQDDSPDNVARPYCYPPSSGNNNVLRVDNNEKGLHLDIYRGLFSSSTETAVATTTCSTITSNDDRPATTPTKKTKDNICSNNWYQELLTKVRWYRVKYKSNRFQTNCETPCWTAFYGGRKEYTPFIPVPEWFQPLVDQITSHVNKKNNYSGDGKKFVRFNSFLLRLYFDGNDEIAWHTDGRSFLGDQPTIASLSLGCNATFQMRRMNNVWPCPDGAKSTDGCVDVSTPLQSFTLRDGDLLVMRGNTQKHWHHRIPKEKGRGVRININFRYILPGLDAERGQMTYYKYMMYGDCPIHCDPPSWTFEEIMFRRGGIMNFVQKGVKCKRSYVFPRGQNRKKRIMEDGDKKCTTKHSDLSDCDAEQYLACEQSIDRDVFMSLPEEIRKEIVSEWKSKKQQPNSQPTASISSSYSKIFAYDSNCKRKPTFGNGLSSFAKKKIKKRITIDSFFAKKDTS